MINKIFMNYLQYFLLFAVCSFTLGSYRTVVFAQDSNDSKSVDEYISEARSKVEIKKTFDESIINKFLDLYESDQNIGRDIRLKDEIEDFLNQKIFSNATGTVSDFLKQAWIKSEEQHRDCRLRFRLFTICVDTSKFIDDNREFWQEFFLRRYIHDHIKKLGRFLTYGDFYNGNLGIKLRFNKLVAKGKVFLSLYDSMNSFRNKARELFGEEFYFLNVPSEVFDAEYFDRIKNDPEYRQQVNSKVLDYIVSWSVNQNDGYIPILTDFGKQPGRVGFTYLPVVGGRGLYRLQGEYIEAVRAHAISKGIRLKEGNKPVVSKISSEDDRDLEENKAKFRAKYRPLVEEIYRAIKVGKVDANLKDRFTAMTLEWIANFNNNEFVQLHQYERTDIGISRKRVVSSSNALFGSMYEFQHYAINYALRNGVEFKVREDVTVSTQNNFLTKEDVLSMMYRWIDNHKRIPVYGDFGLDVFNGKIGVCYTTALYLFGTNDYNKVLSEFYKYLKVDEERSKYLSILDEFILSSPSSVSKSKNEDKDINTDEDKKMDVDEDISFKRLPSNQYTARQKVGTARSTAKQLIPKEIRGDSAATLEYVISKYIYPWILDNQRYPAPADFKVSKKGGIPFSSTILFSSKTGIIKGFGPFMHYVRQRCEELAAKDNKSLNFSSTIALTKEDHSIPPQIKSDPQKASMYLIEHYIYPWYKKIGALPNRGDYSAKAKKGKIPFGYSVLFKGNRRLLGSYTEFRQLAYDYCKEQEALEKIPAPLRHNPASVREYIISEYISPWYKTRGFLPAKADYSISGKNGKIPFSFYSLFSGSKRLLGDFSEFNNQVLSQFREKVTLEDIPEKIREDKASTLDYIITHHIYPWFLKNKRYPTKEDFSLVKKGSIPYLPSYLFEGESGLINGFDPFMELVTQRCQQLSQKDQGKSDYRGGRILTLIDNSVPAEIEKDPYEFSMYIIRNYVYPWYKKYKTLPSRTDYSSLGGEDKIPFSFVELFESKKRKIGEYSKFKELAYDYCTKKYTIEILPDSVQRNSVAVSNYIISEYIYPWYKEHSSLPIRKDYSISGGKNKIPFSYHALFEGNGRLVGDFSAFNTQARSFCRKNLALESIPEDVKKDKFDTIDYIIMQFIYPWIKANKRFPDKEDFNLAKEEAIPFSPQYLYEDETSPIKGYGAFIQYVRKMCEDLAEEDLKNNDYVGKAVLTEIDNPIPSKIIKYPKKVARFLVRTYIYPWYQKHGSLPSKLDYSAVGGDDKIPFDYKSLFVTKNRLIGNFAGFQKFADSLIKEMEEIEIQERSVENSTLTNTKTASLEDSSSLQSDIVSTVEDKDDEEDNDTDIEQSSVTTDSSKDITREDKQDKIELLGTRLLDALFSQQQYLASSLTDELIEEIISYPVTELYNEMFSSKIGFIKYLEFLAKKQNRDIKVRLKLFIIDVNSTDFSDPDTVKKYQDIFISTYLPTYLDKLKRFITVEDLEKDIFGVGEIFTGLISAMKHKGVFEDLEQIYKLCKPDLISQYPFLEKVDIKPKEEYYDVTGWEFFVDEKIKHNRSLVQQHFVLNHVLKWFNSNPKARLTESVFRKNILSKAYIPYSLDTLLKPNDKLGGMTVFDSFTQFEQIAEYIFFLRGLKSYIQEPTKVYDTQMISRIIDEHIFPYIRMYREFPSKGYISQSMVIENARSGRMYGDISDVFLDEKTLTTIKVLVFLDILKNRQEDFYSVFFSPGLRILDEGFDVNSIEDRFVRRKYMMDYLMFYLDPWIGFNKVFPMIEDLKGKELMIPGIDVVGEKGLFTSLGQLQRYYMDFKKFETKIRQNSCQNMMSER